MITNFFLKFLILFLKSNKIVLKLENNTVIIITEYRNVGFISVSCKSVLKDLNSECINKFEVKL